MWTADNRPRYNRDKLRYPSDLTDAEWAHIEPLIPPGKPGGGKRRVASKTGAELLFEVFSQRYEGGSTLVTSNLPFDEWTEVFGSERLTGALLDRLTHHVHILEMNGDSYRLNQSQKRRKPPKT